MNAPPPMKKPRRAPINRRQALGLALGLGALPALGLCQAAAQGNAPSAPTAPALPAPPAPPADDFTALPGTRIRFADVAQARALLMAQDEWMAATSAFNRRAIMGSAAPVTRDAFQAWNADAARPWPAPRVAHWTQALQAITPALAALRLPLPAEVWLVLSNGQESAGAPYTRGRFIVLPDSAITASVPPTALLAHELWHVASRHDPALATRLYAELGFEPMAPLRLPEAWAHIALANPDAPAHRHALRLTLADGSTPWIAPVLVARRTELKPGETFFSVLDVRLLEVQPGAPGSPSTAVLRAGQPVWHPVNGRHDYLRQLGGNTGYVMHPEEALADNIALLVTGGPARNPALLDRLRAVLRARP